MPFFPHNWTRLTLFALVIVFVWLTFCWLHVDHSKTLHRTNRPPVFAVSVDGPTSTSVHPTTGPKPYNFGDRENVEPSFRPENLVLYTRLTIAKGWNEVRSCFFPSMQLFWPHANILIGLDAESPTDQNAAREMEKLVADQYAPLRTKAVLIPEHPEMAGVKGYTGYQRGQLDMMFSDLVVKSKYVGLFDSDTTMVTLVMPGTVFAADGRPIVHASISRSSNNDWWAKVKVGKSVFFALKLKYLVSCMSFFPVVLDPIHIRMMREHVEKVHGKPFIEIYKQIVLNYGYYCHYSIMCNYIWHRHRDKYVWKYDNYWRYEGDWNATREGEISDFSFLTKENTRPIIRISAHFSYTSLGPYDLPRGDKMIARGKNDHLKNRYQPEKVRPLLENAFCYVSLAQCRNTSLCNRIAQNCARLGAVENQVQVSLYRFEIYQTWEWEPRCLQVQKEHYALVKAYRDWWPYGARIYSKLYPESYKRIVESTFEATDLRKKAITWIAILFLFLTLSIIVSNWHLIFR